MATPGGLGLSTAEGRFVRKALIVAALAAALFALIRIVDVLLLAFAAVLMSLFLRAVAAPIRRRTRLGPSTSLAVAVVVLAALAGLALWLFGNEAAGQLAALSLSLPVAWAKLQADLSASFVGSRLLLELRALDGRAGSLLAWAPRLAGEFASATADGVIALFAGLFIALQPDLYLRGFVRLFPIRRRPQAEGVLLGCGAALRQWLVGQVSSMAFMGLAVGAGLWLAGVRSPLGLGLLAAVGQVVPLIGPFVVAAPGVLLALSDSPEKALSAALIYLAVGQVKANLFSPLIMRQMVKLPMAATLFSVLAFGALFGAMGVLLATPLAVVIFVLVRRLYIEGLLGDARAD